MVRPLKVATPLTAATVAVPTNEPGPLNIERVTSELLEVAIFPNQSSTSTVTVGLNGLPAVRFVGLCAKVRYLETPTEPTRPGMRRLAMGEPSPVTRS